MWFVFPQLAGFGSSPTARYYARRSPRPRRTQGTLAGPRLREITAVASVVEGGSAYDVFGSPDDLEAVPCAIARAVSPPGSVFDQLLAKYFDGQPDRRTLDLLGARFRLLSSRTVRVPRARSRKRQPNHPQDRLRGFPRVGKREAASGN